MNNKIKTKIYAFLTILCWASSFVSTKIILSSGFLSPFELGILRYFFAAILLIPIIFIMKLRIPKLKDWYKFLISGFLGYAGYVFLFNTAISIINPSTSSVINAICPGLTSIVAYFLFKEKIPFMGIISLLISFVGILILCLWGDTFSMNIGVIYMLGAAVCLSLYNIAQRVLSKDYSSSEVAFFSILFGTILLIISKPNSILLLKNLNSTVFLHLVFLAIFPTLIAYSLWSKAFLICENTSDVTNFMFLTPVVTTLMSFFAIKEYPEMNTYVGGIFILLGMIMFQKSKNKASK